MIEQVAFRVDSGTALGVGHLTRCLTLAAGLAEKGTRCRFIGRAHEGHRLDLAHAAGHETLGMDAATKATADPNTWLGTTSDEDAMATTEVLGSGDPVDWLIVDHYGVDATWHDRVREVCGNVMAIDDLANRQMHVDLLLDHNYGAKEKPYARVAPDAQLLLGPRHALLDPRFRQVRARARAVTPRPERESRVLVSLGGSDPDNVTTWVLNTLAEDMNRAAAVAVVIGRSHPAPRDVARACESLVNATLHVQTNDMPSLLANADFAIGAGGVSTLERSCVGVPTLALALAANQASALNALDQDGFLVHVESFRDDPGRFQWRYRDFVSNLEQRGDMSTAGRRAVDGRGLERVVDKLLGIQHDADGQIGGHHA